MRYYKVEFPVKRMKDNTKFFIDQTVLDSKQLLELKNHIEQINKTIGYLYTIDEYYLAKITKETTFYSLGSDTVERFYVTFHLEPKDKVTSLQMQNLQMFKRIYGRLPLTVDEEIEAKHIGRQMVWKELMAKNTDVVFTEQSD